MADTLERKLKLVRMRLATVQGQILVASEASLDEIMLEAKLGIIEQLDREHQELILELTEEIEEEEMQGLFVQVAQFDKDYGDLNIQIRRKLKALRPPQPAVKIEAPPSNRSDALPPIPMPTFDGEYSEFVGFREEFEKRVASRRDLDDSAKLHYLRASLCGDASSIQSATDTFEALWMAVKERYQVKRLLSESHINQLFTLKRMTRESASELQRVLDVVVKNLRVLESLELPLDRLSEQMVVNILVNKLDDETRKAFQVTQKSNSMSSWSEMFHFLQDRCHALGGIELSRASSSRGGSSRPLSVEKLSHNRSHALHATETAPIECPRCRRKNHVLLNCYKFRKIGAENQLEMAVKYGICTKCLRESHSPKDCEDEPCDKCQDNHHTSLHSAFSKKSDELSPADQTFSLHTSVSFGINKKVMLSTVLLHILDANGHPHVCRALLDSGSESSMISEELAQTLKLRKIPTTTSIVGINGAQPIRSRVHATIKSMATAYVETLEFVVKTIPADYPASFVDTKS